MSATITIPQDLADRILKHLVDVMSTDEGHLIFDTTDQHGAVLDDLVQLYRHIIKQAL